ncbi:MAG: CBS and ACT domain-containing protein [Desulfobacteraceae bacterium]|jgi:acetoin utilization protein AcuB
MLVKNWMSRPAITIDADAMLSEAIKLLKQHKIHLLPVLEEDHIVGIVTEIDLRKAAGSDASPVKHSDLEKPRPTTKIRDIMVKAPVTIPYNYTIEETAELQLVHNISGVPVVDEQEKIVGVITKTDIFKYIITLAGARKKGVQLALELADRPENVNEITETIRDHGARISNFLSTQRRARNGYRKVYIHINDIDRPTLLRLKEILKEKTNLLYIIDHMDMTREMF